ncbi:MAG: COX15/CtaA family protein [Opitutae bacterium]|nr:COX15/CtaA family protein [Opitutae bacterium]
MPRHAHYKPGLAWFAALGSAWVFVLVALGAFTTSIGAGMAFPDWPLSNGSVNPHGWLTELDKFAEHSHRLSAVMMSTVTIILAVWLWRAEARAWLRKLAYFAVGLVLTQAVVGGLRVLLDRMHVEMVDTSVGRMFAMLHAVLAQAFVCTLFAIALACSRSWIEHRAGLHGAPADGLRRLGRWCVGLLFAQLAIAAIVRHSFAGLAISTFPMSTPDGALLPAAWDFRVLIHFAHRAMAAVIGVAVLAYAWRLLREAAIAPFLRGSGVLLVSLICLQIAFGAQIIWTGRSVVMTTGHVIVGALTLATTFLVTFALHRERVESAPSS